MGVYTVNVAGESYQNEDGSARQRIIKKCREGQPVELIPDPDNPYDENAVIVTTKKGQIGFIERGNAGWISRVLCEDTKISATILKITGGGFLFKRTRGVVLEVRTADDA